MNARLIPLAVLFLLLLSFPLISIADRARLCMGIPVLFIYVFAVWAIVILITAWTHRPKKKGQDHG